MKIHRLLTDSIGYAFDSHLWLTDQKDTIRETGSTIWKKANSAWKIIEYNNLLHYAGKDLGK